MTRRPSYSSSDRLDDGEVVDLFVQRVDELRRTQLIRTGELHTSFNVRAVAGGTSGLTVYQPDEELLRSFLLTFRQFVSEGEPVYLRTVAGILGKHLASDWFRASLADERRRYEGVRKVGMIGLRFNAERLVPEQVWDLWINGQYFHNDSRKLKAIRALDPIGTLLSRHVFLDYIIGATNYVTALNELIETAQAEGMI